MQRRNVLAFCAAQSARAGVGVTERESDAGLILTLLAIVVGSMAFGAWVDSFGAGIWMFVVLMWAEGLSQNVRRT